LASEHLEKWKEIMSSIVCATKQKIMSVRRSYLGAATALRDLHVFCDASRRAYGAVAYLVHQGEASFVESKGRITPIKSQQKEEDRELSIPESKLMAAYLGVLIATNIIAALEPLGIKLRVYLWSDSQIVHHWISKEEGHPRQFFTNRVKKIRDFNRTQAATWKYVPSVENPADILSRGASFKELKASKLWKEGPNG
jgi:Pao retrotransposon peptidase